MPVEKRLEYVIQATASVWEPLEQVHYVGDVNFDSFGMGRRWDVRRWLPPSWDLLEDDASVVNSAVMPTSDCERT